MRSFLSQRLAEKLQEGIKFVQEQDEKLQPVIDYLTECCIKQMDDLSPDKKFEYLIQVMNLKVESLLLLTKLKETLEYSKTS